MSAHWSEHREGGSRFALWLIRTFGLRFGRSCSRLLLYPITLYFFLRRGAERRASYDYLQRITGRPANWRMVYRHIHCFAATILDRIYLLTDHLRNSTCARSGSMNCTHRCAQIAACCCSART